MNPEFPDRAMWEHQLPAIERDLMIRWSLHRSASGETYRGFCSRVTAVVCRDGTPAMLKVAWPHQEGRHEIQGLQFWDGDPTVRLIESDIPSNTLLLERCVPGTPLSRLPGDQQDVILCGVLNRMWRRPPADAPFRPLAEMLVSWAAETGMDVTCWPDSGLVREGLALFESLSRPGESDVLLATDLHAGNVLKAQRQPWLAIDPKPFVGDPAYDLTQHLLNHLDRLFTNPERTIKDLAERAGISAERVYLWLFARAAAEPRTDWNDVRFFLARRLERYQPSYH